MRTDVHNHALPQGAIDLLVSDQVYGVQIDGREWSRGHHPPFTIADSFIEPDAKLAELEAHGLGAAVVSVIPPLFYPGLELEPLEALCDEVNWGLSAFQAAHPGRFRWLAHVPLGFPDRAAELLAAAVGDGAVGVEIPTHVNGRPLDDSEFDAFWSAVDELGVPVLMHPFDNEPHEGLEAWYLQNVIGNQLETTVAVERLICAGTLDRHPGVRIVLVHAGGYFPYQAGRLRHARTTRPELADAPTDPWRYLGQLVPDTITHDRDALAYMVGRVGAENVVLGTDLPFDMATPEPWAALVAAVGEDTARVIAEESPARLFGFEWATQ